MRWSVGSLPRGREMVDNSCQSLSKVSPDPWSRDSILLNESENQEAVLNFPAVK